MDSDRPLLGVECIDVLDGFFELRARSTTLHGDAPVRAVQACPPFAQGSGFGWELRYSGVGLALQAQQEPAVHMIDEMTPGFDYVGRVKSASAQGYLSPRDAQQLHKGWWWRDTQTSQHINLWTGLVVKPGPDCHLRLTELFNSPHLQLDIEEQFFDRSDGWSPLVLRFALRESERSAIVGTVASLSPLPAASAMQTSSLSDYPWVGQRVLDYYSPSYYEQKVSAPPTRAYARLLRRQIDQPTWQADQRANHALAIAACPEDAESIRYHRWSSGPGPTFAELRAPADIRLLYLGRSFDTSMGDGWAQAYAQTKQVWTQLYGTLGSQYLDNATFDGSSCVHPTSGHPVLVLNVEPLLRFVTQPGWSLVFEGASASFAWGLRGIVASDRFHSGALAFQCFDTPKTQVIEQGNLLGKAVPIPNQLLDAQFRVQPLLP